MVAVGVFLSVGPTVRASAAQCPDGSPPPCRAPTRAAAPAPNSVAVLYFDNLSRDTADAYLADGLTEEITVRLGRIDRLAVKSRNAVRRYRGHVIDDPESLGRALGVSYLVSGSVRRSGSRVRVGVELTRAATGVRRWGDEYERADTDLFAIEEAVAGAVTEQIAGRLLPAERASVAARPTRNPEAYDHLLRGHYYLAQRTQRSTARAIDEYTAATRLDSSFVQALARAAYGYALFPTWGWQYSGLPAESLLARGFALVDRALGHDSNMADAWVARGFLLTHKHPRTLEGAREAFERAIALDPRNAEAYHRYAFTSELLDADSAAVAASEHALALEPERPVTLTDLADLDFLRRRYREAVRLADSALKVDPGFYYGYVDRSRSRLYAGDIAGARADAETALRLGSDDPRLAEAVLADVEVREGDTAAARARLDGLLHELPDTGSIGGLVVRFFASTLVALGERERALDLLERIRPRGALMWYWLRQPDFDPVRSHPRFQRLVEESRPPTAPR